MKQSLAVVLTTLALASCSNSPFQSVSQLAAMNDYAGVLELLRAQNSNPQDEETQELQALAYFVEDSLAEGFSVLRNIRNSRPDGAFHAAGIIMKAVNVMSREKSRAVDVVPMLDSAVVMDPSLTAQSVGIAWQRAIEYLNSSGDAGMIYMDFALKYDPQSIGRLRAHDIIIARRYEELVNVSRMLPKYADYSRQYFLAYGNFPANLPELQRAYPEAGLTGRDGWDFTFTGRDGKFVAEASSRLKNQFGIKRGTVLRGG